MQRKPPSKIVTLHSGQLECKCKVGKEEKEEEASQKLEIEPAHCQKTTRYDALQNESNSEVSPLFILSENSRKEVGGEIALACIIMNSRRGGNQPVKIF